LAEGPEPCLGGRPEQELAADRHGLRAGDGAARPVHLDRLRVRGSGDAPERDEERQCEPGRARGPDHR